MLIMHAYLLRHVLGQEALQMPTAYPAFMLHSNGVSLCYNFQRFQPVAATADMLHLRLLPDFHKRLSKGLRMLQTRLTLL